MSNVDVESAAMNASRLNDTCLSFSSSFDTIIIRCTFYIISSRYSTRPSCLDHALLIYLFLACSDTDLTAYYDHISRSLRPTHGCERCTVIDGNQIIFTIQLTTRTATCCQLARNEERLQGVNFTIKFSSKVTLYFKR